MAPNGSSPYTFFGRVLNSGSTWHSPFPQGPRFELVAGQHGLWPIFSSMALQACRTRSIIHSRRAIRPIRLSPFVPEASRGPRPSGR